MRLGLRFERILVEPQTILGMKIPLLFPLLNLPVPTPQSIVAPGSPKEGPGYFDILYLDSDCLIISQASPGGIFISIRDDANFFASQ